MHAAEIESAHAQPRPPPPPSSPRRNASRGAALLLCLAWALQSWPEGSAWNIACWPAYLLYFAALEFLGAIARFFACGVLPCFAGGSWA